MERDLTGRDDAVERENICRFVERTLPEDTVQTLNFIYETAPEKMEQLRLPSVYMLHLVCEGSGQLAMGDRIFSLQKGDLFFSFPAKPFSLPAPQHLRYCYISFMGLGVAPILEKLGACPACPVFHGYEQLLPLWEDALRRGVTESMELFSKGVLFYSLAMLDSASHPQSRPAKNDDIVLKIQSYMDQHYEDSSLTLQQICKQFNYNEKYISQLFKKRVGVGYAEYLRVLRIQHACVWIQQGITSSKELARMVGFEDPLYFSKVFKQVMHCTPREHIADISQRGETVR